MKWLLLQGLIWWIFWCYVGLRDLQCSKQSVFLWETQTCRGCELMRHPQLKCSWKIAPKQVADERTAGQFFLNWGFLPFWRSLSGHGKVKFICLVVTRVRASAWHEHLAPIHIRWVILVPTGLFGTFLTSFTSPFTRKKERKQVYLYPWRDQLLCHGCSKMSEWGQDEDKWLCVLHLSSLCSSRI